MAFYVIERFDDEREKYTYFNVYLPVWGTYITENNLIDSDGKTHPGDPYYEDWAATAQQWNAKLMEVTKTKINLNGGDDTYERKP